MDKKSDNSQFSSGEVDPLAESLRESAQLRDMLAAFLEKYREIDRKYPLKTRSKYKD